MTIDEQLAELAPEPQHTHVTSLQTAVLTRALSPSARPARRRPRTRTLVVAGAVAATAAVAVLVPALKSSPNAAPASALERLATTAASSSQTPMGDRWLHVTRRVVVGDQPASGVVRFTDTEDLWTRADGTSYERHDETETRTVGVGSATRTVTIRTVNYETTRAGAWDSPREVAELPTDPHRLRKSLVPHLTKNSDYSRAAQDDSIFSVLFAVLNAYPPPAVRAAVIRLAGSLVGVTVRATGNRTVITDTSAPTDKDAQYTTQSLVFDSRNAAWQSFSAVAAVGDTSSTATLTGSTVVDSVPTDVIRHATHR